MENKDTTGQAVELMKPRVKLEIRYPHYPFDGDVLLVDEQGELYHETEGYPQSIYKILESDIQNCKCFRIMNWWEERTIMELPDYIKWISPGQDVVTFFKVNNWYSSPNSFNIAGCDVDEGRLFIKDCLPATETEYNTYKNNL